MFIEIASGGAGLIKVDQTSPAVRNQSHLHQAWL